MVRRPLHGMALAGAPNFRDVGGCPASAGLRVRRGRIFRSQVLTDATAEDLELIGRLEIGAVLDLRDADERHRRNRWPRGTTPQAIPVDPGRSGDGIGAAHLKRWLQDPAFDEDEARAVLERTYREMPRVYAPHLAALFTWLAQPARPAVLIHCEAGKDRTGFVCAVLLLALGAPLEAVREDYLLSRDRYGVAELRKAVGDELPASAHRALRVLAGVDADYLDAALAQIDAQHGALEAYLRNGVGVTREQLGAVRSSVLER